MQRTGKAKTVIWRWQERFGAKGVAGLWRDKTRPHRQPVTYFKCKRFSHIVCSLLRGY
jgi:hypothetical protein